jgi:hypothetical protein
LNIKLKKPEKQQLIEYLYRLPNMIFMYWASSIDATFKDIISELKQLPYFCANNDESKVLSEKKERELEGKLRHFFSRYSTALLLNLYYIPVIHAAGKTTLGYLTNREFFDFSKAPTHKLEYLMMLEQDTNNDDFIKYALDLTRELKDDVSSLMLSWIVRHGIITRGDKRTDVERLEQKFSRREQKCLS